MPKLEFTDHQRQAIDTVGGSLLVSAAAGSGKTAVLTERVIQLLTGEKWIPADRLIVVTFTVSAADEMRRRISDRLSEMIAEDPENDLLQSQRLLLPCAKICTIHSLCSSLIKDNFQKLGMSGEFKIAEEPDMAVIKAQAVDEVLNEMYEEGNDNFLHLVEFTCVKNDKPLADLVISIYDFIRSFAFPLDFLDKTLSFYQNATSVSESAWGKSVCHYVCSALHECELILQNCIDEMSIDNVVFDKYYESFSYDLAQISYIDFLVSQFRMEEAAECASHVKKLPLHPVRKYSSPEFLEYLKNRRKKVYTIFLDIVKRFLCFSEKDFLEDIAVLKPHIMMLFSIVKSVYGLIEDKKRENDVIDYADLEHFALDLLVKKTPNGYRKTETAEEISLQYDQIMIDECQDINEVQNLIFTLLSQNETNLFMVGDVKQSIYRFRKAMPKLFIDKKKRFKRYDSVLHNEKSKETIILETNFRSRKEVCDIVNYIFSRIMTEEMGEIDYIKEEELVPGTSFPKYEKACPEVHILDYSKEIEEDKTAAEAHYIAQLIQNMVTEGYKVFSKNEMRPCSYRDFAVLLRSYKEKAPVYAKEMEALGIPTFCESSEGYFDSYEVMVILNFLRVIDNPLLDVPLLSVLMSPMYSFTADKITEIRLAGQNVPFYTALLVLAEQGDSQCSEFVAVLREFRKKAIMEKVDSLIQDIYDQTDFLALACVMSGSGEKDANLRLLLTYAAKYETFGSNGLSGFLRYIDRVIKTGGDFTAANTASVNNDAVRILSIHKSKGLEFPICIVADCGKRFNKRDLNNKYQFNAELGFSMKITDSANLKSYSSLPFEAIRLKTEMESISEEMRVLYVAMTRAKEKLIMVMTLNNAEKKLRSIVDSRIGKKEFSPFEVFRAHGFDDWILSVLISHPGFGDIRRKINRVFVPDMNMDFHVKGILISPAEKSETVEMGKQEFTSPVLPELVASIEKSIQFKYPYLPLTVLPAKLTVTQIAKQTQENKITLKTRPAFLQKQGFTSAQRGTILHNFMQFADFSAAETDLQQEVSRLVLHKFLTQEEAEALNLFKIEAFLHSELYFRMKKADRLLREYKFLYFIKAGDVYKDIAPSFKDTEILIQGIADCLIFEPDGIVIVDYKTDYAKEDQTLIDRYYDQLRIYKDAMEQAFSMPVKQCLLYSVYLEKEIEIIIHMGEK